MAKRPDSFAAPTEDSEQKQFLDCAPPWCKVNAAYEVLRRLPEFAKGKGTDPGVVKSWLALGKSLLDDLLRPDSGLPPRSRASLSRSYGDFFYRTADGTIAMAFPQGASADWYALAFHAYASSLQADPAQPEVWRSAAYLLNKKGDRDRALAALLVGYDKGLPYDAFISDFSYVGGLEHKPSRPSEDLHALGLAAHGAAVSRNAVVSEKEWKAVMEKHRVNPDALAKDLLEELTTGKPKRNH